MPKIGRSTTGTGTGIYNASTPSLADQDEASLQLDSAGNLMVKTVNAGSGSNPAAGATGAAVPADADYQGVNIGGTLNGVTGLAAGATVKAMTVAVVDGSGNQVTSFGGSGGNAAAGPTGSAVPADADYVGFNSAGNLVGVSSAAPLPVTLANTGANATAVKVDGSGVTQPVSLASTAVAGTQAAASTTIPNPVVIGGSDFGGTPAVRVAKIDSSGNQSVVFPSAQAVSGTVTANQGTAAAAAGSWPVEVTDGTNVLGVAAHPLQVSLANTAANATAVKVDNSGVTQPVSGTVTANQGTANAAPWNENISQVGGASAATAASGTLKVGVVGNAGAAFDAATNAAAPANAVQVGGVARTANPSSFTATGLAPVYLDLAGRVIVRSGGPRERLVKNSLTLTATGSNTLIAAGAASVFRDITFLQASNTSGTNVRVDISDGTTTYSWFLAANGGGFNINFDPPLIATTAATAWTAAISANVTDVRISAQAVETL